MRPTFLALLGALVAGLLLSGCGRLGLDREQSLVCVAVATAIGPEGRPITIHSVEPLGGMANAVRVTFSAAGDGRSLFADCAFDGASLQSGRGALVAVRGYEGRLADWRLQLMKRWFLDQPGAIELAVAETGWQPPSRALLPLAPPAGLAYAVQQVLNGLALAAFYVPLALAYALVYGLIGRINLAFGELAVIGAYGAVFGIVTALGARLFSPGAAVLLALAFAVALTVLAGWLIGRMVVVPLIERSGLSFIVATVGLGLALAEGLRLLQGASEVWLPPILAVPIVVTEGPFPVVVTGMRLLVVVASVATVGGLLLYMRRSTFGRAWQAVADDGLMARLCGIDPVAVVGLTSILAAAVAALAGAKLTLSYGGTTHSGGFLLGLKALIACLVGGGTLGGAVAGGLLLAAMETGWSAWFGIGERDIFVLAAITLLFLARPHGLAGRSPALEEGRVMRLS